MHPVPSTFPHCNCPCVSSVGDVPDQERKSPIARGVQPNVSGLIPLWNRFGPASPPEDVSGARKGPIGKSARSQENDPNSPPMGEEFTSAPNTIQLKLWPAFHDESWLSRIS